MEIDQYITKEQTKDNTLILYLHNPPILISKLKQTSELVIND